MGAENMKLLEKGDVKDSTQVLHKLCDQICGRKGPSFNDYKHWSLEEWFQLTDEYTKLIKESLRCDLNKEEVLKLIDCLASDFQQEVLDVIFARKDDLKKFLMSETCKISKSYLQDFDWQVKLIMSSDKLASIQEPVLSLNLDVVTGDEQKPVNLELGKEELKKLINSLEVANKAVTQLQT